MSNPPAKFSLRLPAERRSPRGTTPPPGDGATPWGADLPDAAFDNILARRCVAYAIDFALLGLLLIAFGGMTVLLGALTLGLVWLWTPLPLGLIIIFYSALTIGAPAMQGSPGMRLMRLRVASWRKGEPPGVLRGFLMSAIFYATVPATADPSE